MVYIYIYIYIYIFTVSIIIIPPVLHLQWVALLQVQEYLLQGKMAHLLIIKTVAMLLCVWYYPLIGQKVVEIWKEALIFT